MNDSSIPPGPELLIIGYGNELRGDDGVGPKVAAAAEALNLPQVQVITCHQLTPELADPISKANRVVFVDAAVDASTRVQLRDLKPVPSGQILGHAADPSALLALARDLFGRCPAAWWLTIPVERLEFGHQLSPTAQQGLEIALNRIRALAGEIQ